ncbi:MAG: glycerol-3-phosphate 1-O-acyltransferase PlsY [Verrucomicrobia bacterium]|nr:glycerol-3-phosphate 1-O-acyltransferase PlsY [Verrucomicrobiota bacterium]
MDWLPELVVAVVAFLAGSVPTGYLVARAYGVDIRQVGSGNIGATNVLRSVNRWAGRGVFAVDALKGFLPAFLAPILLPQPDSSVTQIIACLCAILGHNYTPWLGFRGGKGVATAAGGFLAICWPAFLIVAAVWFAVFFLSHYVSLASIIAVAALPPLVFAFSDRNWKFTAFATFVAVVTIVRHKSNIQRLLAGTEHKFEKKPS